MGAINPFSSSELSREQVQKIHKEFNSRYMELRKHGVTMENAITATYAGILSVDPSLPKITLTTDKAISAGLIGDL